MRMSEKTTYVQGETATFTVADENYTSVTLRCGELSAPMSLADGIWTARISTAQLHGRCNFALIADGVSVGDGSIYVRPLVSKWRKVVDAIDAAMQKNAANGKYTVSIDGISLTDKTFDEMVKFREYYNGLAEGDEDGTGAAAGPRFTLGVYA